MVEMLLAFPAKLATIAAVSAAKARPFSPVGKIFNNTGYALSGFTIPFWVIPFTIAGSAFSWNNTYAAKPGNNTKSLTFLILMQITNRS